MVCTDEGDMRMKNGKTFHTGNHLVEMLVPMLHFRDAGFNFDIATASGKPVVLEVKIFVADFESADLVVSDLMPALADDAAATAVSYTHLTLPTKRIV